MARLYNESCSSSLTAIASTIDSLDSQLSQLYETIISRHGPTYTYLISSQLLVKYILNITDELHDLRTIFSSDSSSHAYYQSMLRRSPAEKIIWTDTITFVLDNLKLTTEALVFRVEEAEIEYRENVPIWNRMKKKRDWFMNVEETAAFEKLTDGYIGMVASCRSLVYGVDVTDQLTRAKRVYQIVEGNVQFPLHYGARAAWARFSDTSIDGGNSVSAYLNTYSCSPATATVDPAGANTSIASVKKLGSWPVKLKFEDVYAGYGNITIWNSSADPKLVFKPLNQPDIYFGITKAVWTHMTNSKSIYHPDLEPDERGLLVHGVQLKLDTNLHKSVRVTVTGSEPTIRAFKIGIHRCVFDL